MSYFKDVNFDDIAGKTSEDYSASIDPRKILNDPAFLSDLRGYYREKGEFFADDKHLVDKFYSDRTWADLNTVGAIGDALEATSANADQRQRMKRIETVWRQLPNFWQEGGRGAGALGDIATSIIADPLNLIPGVAGYKGAATAGRAAYLAGKSAPVARGVASGTARAAGSEAAISAGQEAIVNTATQARDIQLGLQDEFSRGQLGAAALTGGVLGGAVGGAIGLPAAIAGARSGVIPAETLSRMGMTREQLAAMPPEELDAFYRNMQESGATGLLPPQPEAPAPEAEAPPQTTLNTAEFGDLAGDLADVTSQLNAATTAARSHLDRIRASGAEAETINNAVNETADMAALRTAVARAEREAKQIAELEKSNDVADINKARDMRRRYEDYMSQVRRVLQTSDGLNPDEMLARMERDGFGMRQTPEAEPDAPEGELAPAAEAPPETEIMTDAPSTDGPMETTSAPGTDAPTTPEPEAAPEASAEPDPLDEYRQLGKKDVRNAGVFTKRLDAKLAALRQNVGPEAADAYEAAARAQVQANMDARAAKKAASAAPELTPDEKLEGVLAQVDLDNEAFRDNPLELLDAIRAQANASGLTDAEADELAKLYSSRNGLDAAGNAPEISMELRGRALAEGIDWRSLTPSAKSNNRITKGVVSKAIRTRKADAGIDPYATQARKELDDIIDLLDAQGDVMDADDIRSGVALLGRASDFETDLDDLLALAEYDISRSTMLDESRSDIFTQTELKQIARLKKQYKKEMPDASDDALTVMAEARITEMRGNKSSSGMRSAQKGIDQKTVYTTAGRSATTGKIQGILRRGTRIAKGSDYTVSSGYNASPADFGREEAMLRANSGKGPDLVPYTTTGAEKVFAPGGLVEVKKGATAWADAVTGRSFSSRDFALKARGEAPSAQPKATQAAPEKGVDETLKSLLAKYAGDGEADVDTLLKELRARKEGKKPEVSVDPATPAEPSPAPSRGDKKLIVRSKENPDDIRIMSKKQIEDGKDIFAIIGQDPKKSSSVYENWDVRYAPMDANPRTQRAREALFDSLPEETTKPIEGGRFNSGNTTGLGDPLLVEDADAIQVTLTPDELAVYTQAARGVGYTDKINNNIVPFGKLRWATTYLDTQFGWPKTVEGQRTIAQSLRTLYSAMHRANPNGFVLANQQRKIAIDNVERTFDGFSSEELSNARKLLQQLGGNPAIAPNIRGGRGGDNLTTMERASAANADSQVINVNTDPSRKLVQPKMAALYHEVAHWAYRNILTPEDRVEFWEHMGTYYNSKGQLDMGAVKDRLPAYTGMENPYGNFSTNTTQNPQEFFANQFSMWAMQNHSNVAIRDMSFWRRMTQYVQAVFDRFFAKESIDPNLEPLFAKILPNRAEERTFQLGVDAAPQGAEGQAIQKRYVQLGMIEQDIESAFASDSADGIITAFDELRKYILGVGRNSEEVLPGVGGSGPLLALRSPKGQPQTMLKVLNEKLKALDEIIGGKPSDLTSIDDAAQARRYLEGGEFSGMSEIADPQAVADLLRDFYYNGYAGKFVPANGVPGQIKKLEKSSVKHMIESVRKALGAGYQRAEGKAELPTGAVPPSVTGGTQPPVRADGNVTPSGTKRKAAKAKKAKEDRTTAQATADTKTQKNKRARNTGKNKPNVDPTVADTVKTLSLKKLQSDFRKHRGTDYGDQVAAEIVAKVKAAPLPTKAVPVRREIMELGGAALEDRLLRAIYEGDKATLNEALWETQYRIAKKKARKTGGKIISRTFRESSLMIMREVNDNVGVTSLDGVPAAARASVRENLSLMTHRDADVQNVTRTMAYRLYNIIGKTSRGGEDSVNLIGTADMSRLAGSDPSFAGDGVFGDYRGADFNSFRKQVRRISSALNKGDGKPDEAIGGLMHMIVRSGALKPEESEAIVEAYRSLDSTMRNRIEGLIGSKYADRSEYVREQAIAEEWFSDAVNRYTREDMPRSQILDGVITGDTNNVRMRSTLDRAIDRTIEYTAYATNGQIGRTDVKGRYRRLTLYGDMFESGEKRPMIGSLDGGVLAHPSYAADYAQDAINSASKPRMANLVNFTKGGVGFDEASQTPNVFYHGTPKGYVFRRTDDNPNAIFKRSQGGNYGPGYYLTANPHVAGEVYAKRPTVEAMFQQAEELGLPTSEKEDLDWDIWDMVETRREISKVRREFSALEDELGINPDVTTGTLDAFRDHLDDLVANEQAIAESLSERGLTIDPYVMPMVIKLNTPVDFRDTASYNASHPMVKSIMAKMNEVGNTSERTFRHIEDAMGGVDVDGTTAYRELVNSLIKSGRNRAAAQEELTGILDDLGYDGMLTTHRNSLADGEDVMANGDTYRASSTTHTSAVLFNPEQAKHIDADYFDSNDEMIYNSIMEFDRPIPKGVNGDIINAVMDESVSSIDEIPVGQFGELLEQEGTNSTITGAVMSMMRKRNMSPSEEQAVRKAGPFKYFERLSTRIKNQGMHWLGDKYKEHYPDMNQRFAKKFMPIADKLAALPDTDGILRGYFRKASASIGQEQPKSYSRIVRALRRGDGSRQERALSADERNIYRQIRATLANERNELIKEGFHVGNRGPNYLPQVWSQKAINKNRPEFIEKMKRYYAIERNNMGAEYTDAEANAFAEGIMLKLLDETEEGVFIPVKGTTKNSAFENVDYSRVIELDKYAETGILDELEKFLEDDLEAILVKYLEGSSRRLTSAKRFGVNSHAVSDYMTVAREGKAGIVALLTKNKQFEYDITAMNPQGRKETASLVDTIRMPFQGDNGEASEFVDKLMEVANTSGPAGARQMLMDIATLGPDGKVNPVYAKRVDAIVGALNDFKGKAGSIAYDEGEEYVDNAMRILMKKPMHGTNKTGMKVSRSLRFFNNVSLLGFTTLTSIGDLGLPIIRSGSFKSWAKSLKELKDPQYREMIRNVGVAMENIVHERMVHLYGAPDNKASHAFFNATLLTPWTDMNRMIAGATGYETFITMQQKAFDTFKTGVPYAQQSAQYKTAHRFLKNYGLAEFLPGAKRAGESLGNRALMQSDDTVRMGVIKFADDAIFQPNPNDIPMWAQTPVGQLVFQLKSFPLMMSRMTGHILSEANQGNFRPLMYLASVGPAFGVVTLSAKDMIQMRGGEDDRSPELRKRNVLKALGYDKKVHGDENDFLGWYVESMMVMGGFGLLGDVIHSAVSQVDNGAYGQQRMWSTVLGPSFGLGNAGMQVTAGIFDEGDNSNSKERSAMREVATRIPILGGNRRIREGIVDATAGEASSGNTGGWQSSWSKSY